MNHASSTTRIRREMCAWLERHGVAVRVSITLAAGLLVALIAAIITSTLFAAVVAGIPAVVLAYIAFGPGEKFFWRGMTMMVFSLTVLVLGIFLSHTNEKLGLWLVIEGVVIFFSFVVVFVFGPGDDSDISAGEGGGPGY